jgi:hypothetical protein
MTKKLNSAGVCKLLGQWCGEVISLLVGDWGIIVGWPTAASIIISVRAASAKAGLIHLPTRVKALKRQSPTNGGGR